MTIDPAGIANEIRMRHYGPVTWNSADGQPFQVHRRKIGSTSEFDWQLQDCFTCALDSTNDTIVKVSTSSVSRLQRGFEYRVSRRLRSDGTNVLRCNLPTGTPEVAYYSPLTFKVCQAFFAHSPGDADDSGLVDANDVDSVLANWGSTACMKFGDADRNGIINTLDLQEAELYNGFEYCYAEGMGVAPQADGFARMGLEAETVASFVPMTLTEAVTEMGYDDTDDFAQQFDAMERAAREIARQVLMALLNGE